MVVLLLLLLVRLKINKPQLIDLVPDTFVRFVTVGIECYRTAVVATARFVTVGIECYRTAVVGTVLVLHIGWLGIAHFDIVHCCSPFADSSQLENWRCHNFEDCKDREPKINI